MLWNRLVRAPTHHLARLFASPLHRIGALEPTLRKCTEDELRRQSLALQYRALSGENLDRLLPEAYALVREAARRALNMRPFDVQVLGGIAIHQGCIAEMQTGEGKTLTALLPLYLASLVGCGAHLATANDYLASRDAELMRPALQLLGKTVGALRSAMPRYQRREAYQCDITYGAAREFGFDFLRDRLRARNVGETPRDFLGAMLGLVDETRTATVQRNLQFVLIDEADSILIDEARTPLIVSSMPGNSRETAEALYRWAAAVASDFGEDADFEHDREKRTVTLCVDGRRKVRDADKPDALSVVAMCDLYEHTELAIRVQREFIRDHHYVVRDDEVIIVDESTGRLAEGRRWREGVHQAVEAKEGVEISVKTGEAARVTVQDFFLRYRRLGGMTGTASSSAGELKRIYNLRVSVIPTNRPDRRTRLPDRIFASAVEKWDAIVQEVLAMHELERPVLVGTRSIELSEQLSRQLRAAGVEHEVLNAQRHAEEAKIVAAAGQRSRVTVATNMAGRGTDIQLGSGVAELGGLHVICSELHESARIDRQLIGRCARQGDPGSFRQFTSLEDDILHLGYGHMLAARLRHPSRYRKPLPRLIRTLRRAQRRVERQHFRQRRLLLHHEKERHKIQRQMGQDPYLDAAQ